MSGSHPSTPCEVYTTSKPSSGPRFSGSSYRSERTNVPSASRPTSTSGLVWLIHYWWCASRAGHTTATCAGRRIMKEGRMPLYLSRFRYTPETWAKLIGNPEDRRIAAQSYIESVGGKLHGFWYAFGTQDRYNLWEAPDNVSMAAVALAIGAGGAPRTI